MPFGSELVSTIAATAPVYAGGSAALTNREREILALLADGLGNKQIATRLGISTNTVKTHLELLFDKGDEAVGVRGHVVQLDALATIGRPAVLIAFLDQFPLEILPLDVVESQRVR